MKGCRRGWPCTLLINRWQIRGWCQLSGFLQEERSGVEVRVQWEKIWEVLESERTGSQIEPMLTSHWLKEIG